MSVSRAVSSEHMCCVWSFKVLHVNFFSRLVVCFFLILVLAQPACYGVSLFRFVQRKFTMQKICKKMWKKLNAWLREKFSFSG